jgi:hypothetical protein
VEQVLTFDPPKIAAVRPDQVEAPVLSFALLEGDPVAAERPGWVLIRGGVARQFAKTAAVSRYDVEVSYSVGFLRDKDELQPFG